MVSQMLDMYDQSEESESEASQPLLSMAQNTKKRLLTERLPEPPSKREQTTLGDEGELEVNLFPGTSNQSIQQSKISAHASTSEGTPSILTLEQARLISTFFITELTCFQ